MAVLLTGWALICVAVPCFLAFTASYYRKRRMMLILIGLLILYSVVMIAGTYTSLLADPATKETRMWSAVYAMLLAFGSGGAGLGLLVGGLGGWLLRGRL